MNASSAVLRAAAEGRAGDAPGTPLWAARRRRRPEAVYGTGLWVFIGVATTLFSLFVTSYVMRMSSADAAAIQMPLQLWLSTALLVLGSVLLQRASWSASELANRSQRHWLMAGGGCAVAFIAVQWWAWQALLAQQITPVGNPAASFFYLLTAMHGLHVAGGLVGWAFTVRATSREPDPAAAAWRIALCARYWHFLLLVWVALFACFTWITPEVARIICRTA